MGKRVIVGRGSYLLIFRLETVLQSVAIGRFGRFDFPSGYYVYVGSAMGSGGLPARLAYHRRRHKARPHWHIDYLRPWMSLMETWAVSSQQRLECSWCQSLLSLPGLSIPVRGFGSRDTGCPAHFFYASTYPGVRSLTSVVLSSVMPPVDSEMELTIDITRYDDSDEA